MPENLYPVFRGTEMRPNYIRLLENSLFPEAFPEDASKPELSELEALRKAKAKQDISHDKLGKWITAAIAELSDEKRATR